MSAERQQRQRYLLRRLFGLAFTYWPECLGLVVLQTLLLALGLAGLGGAGLAIDYLRSLLERQLRRCGFRLAGRRRRAGRRWRCCF